MFSRLVPARTHLARGHASLVARRPAFLLRQQRHAFVNRSFLRAFSTTVAAGKPETVAEAETAAATEGAPAAEAAQKPSVAAEFMEEWKTRVDSLDPEKANEAAAAYRNRLEKDYLEEYPEIEGFQEQMEKHRFMLKETENQIMDLLKSHEVIQKSYNIGEVIEEAWTSENARWDNFFHRYSWVVRSMVGVAVAILIMDFWIASTVEATEVWEDQVPLNNLPWSHDKFGKILDKKALRRGFEVYRQVCATCHSLEFVNFRNLVGVTHSEEQAKNLAASYTYTDGPNDHGEMFERPGRLSDPLPKPYPNAEFARYANGGAFPPDLSLLAKARFDGLDHIFSILVGYVDEDEIPSGVEVREGLSFNKYFPGSLIAMPPPLMDGQVDYEDGTPATVSQMAKDVTEFLYWASEPNYDERARLQTQWLGYFAGLFVAAAMWKRWRWNPIKSRRISYPDSKRW